MGDAFGAKITAAAPDALVAKAETDWLPMAMLAVLAGLFIGFGSIAFLVVQGVAGTATGPVALLSGLGFSVGLVLVMVTGAELFTGNTLFVLPLVRGRLGAGRLAAAWALVWTGNLIGSVIVALLFVGAGAADAVDGLVAAAAVEGAADKAAKGTVELLCSGVLANMLVCLAVWMAMSARSVPSKVLAIVGPITVFVAAGFEHSIANQSLLPIGWLLDSGGAVSVGGIVRNLALSTLGNIVGGASIALAFGYAHRDG